MFLYGICSLLYLDEEFIKIASLFCLEYYLFLSGERVLREREDCNAVDLLSCLRLEFHLFDATPVIKTGIPEKKGSQEGNQA